MATQSSIYRQLAEKHAPGLRQSLAESQASSGIDSGNSVVGRFLHGARKGGSRLFSAFNQDLLEDPLVEAQKQTASVADIYGVDPVELAEKKGNKTSLGLTLAEGAGSLAAQLPQFIGGARALGAVVPGTGMLPAMGRDAALFAGIEAAGAPEGHRIKEGLHGAALGGAFGAVSKGVEPIGSAMGQRLAAAGGFGAIGAADEFITTGDVTATNVATQGVLGALLHSPRIDKDAARRIPLNRGGKPKSFTSGESTSPAPPPGSSGYVPRTAANMLDGTGLPKNSTPIGPRQERKPVKTQEQLIREFEQEKEAEKLRKEILEAQEQERRQRAYETTPEGVPLTEGGYGKPIVPVEAKPDVLGARTGFPVETSAPVENASPVTFPGAENPVAPPARASVDVLGTRVDRDVDTSIPVGTNAGRDASVVTFPGAEKPAPVVIAKDAPVPATAQKNPKKLTDEQLLNLHNARELIMEKIDETEDPAELRVLTEALKRIEKQLDEASLPEKAPPATPAPVKPDMANYDTPPPLSNDGSSSPAPVVSAQGTIAKPPAVKFNTEDSATLAALKKQEDSILKSLQNNVIQGVPEAGAVSKKLSVDASLADMLNNVRGKIDALYKKYEIKPQQVQDHLGSITKTLDETTRRLDETLAGLARRDMRQRTALLDAEKKADTLYGELQQKLKDAEASGDTKTVELLQNALGSIERAKARRVGVEKTLDDVANNPETTPEVATIVKALRDEKGRFLPRSPKPPSPVKEAAAKRGELHIDKDNPPDAHDIVTAMDCRPPDAD